ncbi:MAG TPA: response regulator transcription factor [Polyangiaceae bacterium]|nr:response regulator transcription factor [Polyangiaceae bacterium]
MIRIALADDQTLVRQGIRSLLGLVPDFELVAEASDGEEAVRAVEATRPDVLLLDVRMPRGDGLFVARTLSARGALPPTLVLTTFDDDEAEREALRAGVRGFLLKDVSLERLVAAVRSVAAGGTAFEPGLTERARRDLAGAAPAAVEGGSAEPITAREREVLRLLAAGYSNREIAKTLCVAEGTVKNHVSHILDKLGVRDRTRAVLTAVRLGYL